MGRHEHRGTGTGWAPIGRWASRLVVLVAMNAVAIALRNRYEQKW